MYKFTDGRTDEHTDKRTGGREMIKKNIYFGTFKPPPPPILKNQDEKKLLSMLTLKTVDLLL